MKNFICMRNLAKRNAMRYNIIQHNFSFRNNFHQSINIFLCRCLATFNSYSFIKNLPYRKIIIRCWINTQYRNNATSAHST